MSNSTPSVPHLPLESPLTFISYAKEDREYAQRLFKSLEEANLRPWMDQHHLKPGQQWNTEIMRAIKQCRFFLVLLSTRSINKRGYIQKEMREADDIAKRIPNDSIFILPCKIEECEVPETLQNLQWVDLHKRGGKNKLVKNLIEYLGEEYILPTKSKLNQTSVSANGIPASECLAIEIIERTGSFFHGKLSNTRVAISNGAFMLFRKDFPKYLDDLKKVVGKTAKLSAQKIREVTTPKAGFPSSNRVGMMVIDEKTGDRSIRLISVDKKTKILVDRSILSLALIAFPNGKLYVFDENTPVFVEYFGITQMVFMPLVSPQSSEA